MRFSFSFAFNRSPIAFFFNWLLKKAMFRLLLTRAERNMSVLIAIGSFNYTNHTKNKKILAPMRFERMIFGLGNHCSILLSYEATIKFYHKNGDFALRFSVFQPAVNQNYYNTKSRIITTYK